MNPRALPFVVASLLLGSGACALVYQMAWVRSLRTIFGASTPATSAVLGIFMAGLGLGSWLLSKRAERTDNPLRLYAHLELGIAALTAASPFLIDGVRAVYISLGGSVALGTVGATCVRIVLAALVLGGPVVLMGGTLPAAARAVSASTDVGRRGLALIYGTNTVGGVLGTVLATFVFLEALGVRQTLWLFCLLNALLGVGARALSRHSAAAAAEPVDEDAPAHASGRSLSRPAVLVAAFGTGFAFLLLELVWYRLAAPILGGSTFTFGLILAFALAGIGVGSLVCALTPARFKVPGLFALTCALEAALLALPLLLGDDLALLAHDLRAAFVHSFAGIVFAWSVITAILVLPAAVVAGFQFPLLLSLKGRGARDVATDVGEVYAANTFGTITGSLLGGFVLIPALGAVHSWRLGALVLVVIGLPFLLGDARARWRAAWAVLAALTLAQLTATGPTAVWRHWGIGAGRARVPFTQPAREAWIRDARRSLLAEYDGIESGIGLVATISVSQLTNGKSDGNVLADAATTYGLGLIPATLHPSPRSSFVVGLGSGQTAGALGRVPGMERVDVVELEPKVIEFVKRSDGTHLDVLDNPVVNVLYGDAREVLAVSEVRYDLIISEPSNPYRAGVAGLFTADFYAQAAARLADGGLFAQWLQAYELDAETFVLVIATLRAEFDEVSVWVLGPSDYLLVAGDGERAVDLARVRRLLEVEPFRTFYGRLAGAHDAEGVLARHLAGPDFATHAAGRAPRLNTDDRNLLEYRFARTVGRPYRVDPTEVNASARKLGAHRPRVVGELDWSRVERLRTRPWLKKRQALPRFPKSDPARAAAWTRLQTAQPNPADLAAAAADPADLTWRLELLDARARQGPRTTDAVADFEAEAEALSAHFPTEVAWIRAWRSPLVIAEALRASREDPWGGFFRVRSVLEAVDDAKLSQADAVAIARELLAGPLLGYAAEDLRLSTAANLAFKAADAASCAEAFARVEPNPWWTAPLLSARARCYEADGRAAGAARADLARFAEVAPASLEALLTR